MTDNIRRLFSQMDCSSQEEALLFIKNEFNVQSRKLIVSEWIKGGRIPEAYQERTVKLFQDLLRKQGVRTR